jgi:hypothetical protein
MRYYLGVDWADAEDAVCVLDEAGGKVLRRTVAHTALAQREWGRWLQERRAEGIELWAAIERPHGRTVDFLLDHDVVVYPINPKSLDRARDRFRVSGAKSDPFDAQVLAAFLRSDQATLRPLRPKELKALTRDHRRQVHLQTRLLNQLTATLKEYYPRALEICDDLRRTWARAFLQTFPTPADVATLRVAAWRTFARTRRPAWLRRAGRWRGRRARRTCRAARCSRRGSPSSRRRTGSGSDRDSNDSPRAGTGRVPLGRAG